MNEFVILFIKFPIKKYLALIEGRLIDKKDDISNSRWVYVTGLSLCFIIVFFFYLIFLLAYASGAVFGL